MMSIGGTAHISMIIASVILCAILIVVIVKSSERIQNCIITTISLMAVFGIFFLHGTHYFTDLDFLNLVKQMFQVCNFNFILIPLALFKRNELARQYLFYFSMPAALSTFVTYPSDVQNSMWYSIVTLTFWVNHLFIALVPILLVASKRFKPRINYVHKVIICIILYFGAAFLANYAINGWNIVGESNLSYTMEAGSIMILKPLFKLIPIPYVYLLPIVPALVLIYYLIALVFKKYKLIGTFGFSLKKE